MERIVERNRKAEVCTWPKRSFQKASGNNKYNCFKKRDDSIIFKVKVKVNESIIQIVEQVNLILRHSLQSLYGNKNQSNRKLLL